MRYRFGDFALDTDRYELARAGEKLEVRPKVFDALRYLLERAGRLVTKQELLDALWEGKTVEEASVPWTISYVRRAIGQGAGVKQPLETVHGRGYRWSGAVAVDEGERSAAPVEHVARPFVGRASLLAALRQRVHEMRAGRASACMLVGEAGIGKSRCIDELAAFARAQGCAVWVGRSAPETLAPVYFPWISLLRSAQGHGPELQRQLRALLARLAADTAEGGVERRDAVLGQLSLFDAVGRWLGACSERIPIVLVLEDVHWADQGTLELLGFVADELKHARVLVLAASRHVLCGRAAELVRGVERFDLGPLSVDEVARYLRAQSQGGEPARELCEALHRVSAGYPLFLQETVHGLLAQHGAAALARLDAASIQPSPRTRDALNARLLALPDETRAALACASVFGHELDSASLLRLCELPRDAALRALDDGVQRGFLSSAGVHRFRFRHALFREVVYEALPGPQRAALHRKLALLRAAAPDAAEHKSEIAYHHHRSLALGHHAEVRAAAVAAAELASRALAFGDAAQFYGFALEALAADPQASQREYAQLLLARAQAQRAAGANLDARATIAQLCRVASEHGSGDLLVHAARALRLSHAMGGLPDPLARSALERALELLPESARELRLQALSLLAWLPPDVRDFARRKQQSGALLEQARSSGDRAAVAEALTARLYLLSGPDDIAAELAVCDEILALEGEPRSWVRMEAHAARHSALLLRGDLAAADAALSAMHDLARERGLPELRWHCERLATERRLGRGEFAAAHGELERLANEAKRLRVLAGRPLIALARARLARLSLGRGAAGAPEPAAPQAGAPSLGLEAYPGFRTFIARHALERGHRALARQTLTELSADGCAAVPKDLCYLSTLCDLALIAIGLGERGAAERLVELLAPYAQCNTPNLMRTYEGPVARLLARAAAFLGREQVADRCFAQALERDEQLELWPLLAIDRLRYAEWSLAVGRRAQARALRSKSIELAKSLGMHWLADAPRAGAAG